ncbi:MAG: hypothetical protein EBZ69_09235 [Alphaproteobacteria bacterium]|nr:hypothetical protein [Alphaproteobacteria bacterium]
MVVCRKRHPRLGLCIWPLLQLGIALMVKANINLILELGGKFKVVKVWPKFMSMVRSLRGYQLLTLRQVNLLRRI